MGGNDLGRDGAFSWPSSCCCKIIPLGCHFAPSHHPTAGFFFYITLKVKHLTSPSRHFKAAPSLQITYNSQKVSSLSPDRSLMPASFSLHLLAFQRSSFVSSLTASEELSAHLSELPHYPPSHPMESAPWTECLWQFPDRKVPLSCAAHPQSHHSHLLPAGCLFSCVVRLLSFLSPRPCTELNKLKPLLMTPGHSCNSSLYEQKCDWL